jgi:formyl-CoA transferase
MTPTGPETGRGPLHGIRVLDLSAYIAGPYACSLLADLGAEVVKIEPPQGDTLRHYPSTLPQESRAFLGTNRSKLGIVLDLKKPEAQAVLLRLARSADVLVHNFRPGVPDRLGMGYERLRASNPRLIYCALTGYGEAGPLREKAGYDQVLQSLTGICALQGPPGQPQIVYGSVVDYYAAALVACAIASALFRRQETGEGHYVAVSLLASALAMQSGRFIWADGESREAGRDLRSGGITGIHPTADGDIYISANTPHFWQALCELIGLPELAEDPNFDTIRKRAERAREIVPKVRAALRSRTAIEWETLFADRVPCGAVRPIEEMFDHPQVLAEGLVADFEHPTVGSYRGFAGPFHFSQTPCAQPFAAPALGQHTAELLARYGYSAEELGHLRECGAIGE